MSLKAFHIFFVVVSSLLGAGFSGWALRNALSDAGTAIDWVYGIGGLVATAALVVYGVFVYKKLKRFSYL
jgi:hypothetical protein